MRTHQLEGRKREERVGELRNMAGHKRGLTNWRGGRGRRGVGSGEAWKVANEDSRTSGEEEGGGEGRESEREKTSRGQRAWRSVEGWRGGREVVRSKTWDVANKE